MSDTMDVTNIFWPLVEAIIVLPTDDLMRTRYFRIICELVDSEQSFSLKMFDYELVHEDVNGLFYGTRDFLEKTTHTHELALINAAILKLESILAIQETCKTLSKLSTDGGYSLTGEFCNTPKH